jgi:hypothetical protein
MKLRPWKKTNKSWKARLGPPPKGFIARLCSLLRKNRKIENHRNVKLATVFCTHPMKKKKIKNFQH